MAGTNEDDNMSSDVGNVGSSLLRGEGDLIDQGLLIGGWSRRWGGEKLSVDSDNAGCEGPTPGPTRRWAPLTHWTIGASPNCPFLSPP